jgi:hypothetical protein
MAPYAPIIHLDSGKKKASTSSPNRSTEKAAEADGVRHTGV